MNEKELKIFFQINRFRKYKETFVNALFKEARTNSFNVIIENGKN